VANVSHADYPGLGLTALTDTQVSGHRVDGIALTRRLSSHHRTGRQVVGQFDSLLSKARDLGQASEA
jgi:hypothetical protein